MAGTILSLFRRSLDSLDTLALLTAKTAKIYAADARSLK